MKKLFSIILITYCFQSAVFAQTVMHHAYTTHYNAALKEPDSVVWDLTPAMVSCQSHQARSNTFAEDPKIPNSALPSDYAVNTHPGTGTAHAKTAQIDQGHLFNFEDASCDTIDAVECFFMSNMLPQYDLFNKGDWKALENQERKWAASTQIHIIAGGIGSLGKLPAGENIPAFMYKAIYMNGQWTAWIMPNASTSKGHKYPFWERPISILDSETGLKL